MAVDRKQKTDGSGVIRRMVLTVSLVALAFALGACSSTEHAAEPGEECEEEGQRDGDLVCEDGVWVEDPIEGDAGFDVDEDQECDPESHEEFCERHGVECGSFVGVDNCDQDRSVHCGAFEGFECDESLVCLHAEDHEELDANECRCPELGDQPADQVCDAAGAECGTVDAEEVCGDWEGLGEVECGDCEDADGECGEEVDNICGCPCEIDDTCYTVGESSPDDACMICDPEEDDEGFTEADDGTACGDNAICEDGDCVCQDGTTDCDGDCVDLDSNRDHCGECDNACDSDEVCDDGSCEAGCPEEHSLCDGECVDTDTSLEHCGECNDECSTEADDATAECDGGQCQISCDDDDLNYCSGECVDTQTDEDHCGECGDECSTDVDEATADCEDGECLVECPEDNEQLCDGECVDTEYNDEHCGECDNECGDFQGCWEGSCEGVGGGDCDDEGDCGPGEQCCDGECIGAWENCPDD